jgi:hemerythrin-like domain-containing protein
MTNPITDLIDEHGGIMLMLQIIKQVSRQIKQGEAVPIEDLEKIVEFLREFADKCHHGKEEGILFPQISQPETNQLINDLLGEHKAGRDYIRGMAESLASYQPGNADAVHIALNAEGYITLLTTHIQKENTLLFTEAEASLSPTKQQEIEQQFETLERDVIGAGKHEQYHSWIDQLQHKYLNQHTSE